MKKSLLLFLLLMVALCSVSFAGNVTMFGSKTYVRTTGSPNIYDDSFTAVSGQAQITIKNGSIDGSDRILDTISSAWIYVNGLEIFGPTDFNQNVYLLEATVNLADINDLHIELASNPGSYITIQIIQYIPEPTISLNAQPNPIYVGQSTQLTWDSTNTETCTLDPGIGQVEPSGTLTLSPETTITYTITATNLGGTATQEATITVLPLPTAEMTLFPVTIYEGGVATLSWTSANAESCVINPGVGPVEPSGTMLIYPDETTTYTITASNPGGSADASASVVVMPQFEVDDDTFDEGTFENVEQYQNYLQLTSGLSTLPFIWVANSGEGTVSKIDTLTGVELGRYRTGPTGGTNPSRTTVDSEGNLWVGNRDTASAVKIALYPRDKNGDGVISTSTGPSDILPWGQDEAIELYITGVDNGPRALAIDALNNVWIGGYGRNMGYYDGQTGQKLKNIYIGRDCYGALIDKNGTLWISNKTAGLSRINNPSGSHSLIHISTGGRWVYGIGIDQEGYIYTSAYEHNRLRKLNPANNTWIFDVSISGGYQGRGVAVGLDGDVWVAHSGTDRVTRHNSATGALKATVYVGDMPTGVAVDSVGKIWVTNHNSNTVQRINPDANTVEFTQGGHTRPYNYSDMTGFISRNITTQNGNWSFIFDSQAENTPWGIISWDSYEPPGTQIKTKARTSQDQISWSLWQDVQSGIIIENLPDARYIEVEVAFTITSGDESPLLYDMSISSVWEGFSNTSPEITSDPILVSEEGVIYNYQVMAFDAEDTNLYYSLQEAPEGMTIDMYTGLISWDIDAYQEGEYLVSVKVKDPVGSYDLQHYWLTVSDTLQCNIGETRVCGSSVGTCQMGEQICFDGTWSECEGAIGPEPEICDGLDNNCNLEIDEDLVPPPADIQCGVCQDTEKVCGGSEGWNEPDYSQIPGYEPYETLSDGLDNDCDCEVDVLKTTVPSVLGKPQSEAESIIDLSGMTVGAISFEYSFTVPVNNVISQGIEPEMVVVLNTLLDLVISLGEPKVQVPVVTGISQADAESVISGMEHLLLGDVIGGYSSRYPLGEVYKQYPEAGSLVSYDSSVNIYVSLGVWTGEDNTQPLALLNISDDQIQIGESVSILAWTDDDVGVVDQTLFVNTDSLPVPDDPFIYTPTEPGFYTVTLTAEDAAGHVTSRSITFSVVDPSDSTPPLVSLDQTGCADVTDLYSITGSVSDDSGVEYILYYRTQGASNMDWIKFDEGFGNNISGELGVFDPTLLKNGVYDIMIVAKDLNGNASTETGCIIVDGELKLGQVNLPVEDINIPAQGFPLSLVREYDSRVQDGDFGPGWSLPASSVKPSATNIPGDGWGQEAQGSGLPTYYLLELERHEIVIRFSDSDVLRFEMDVQPDSSVIAPLEYLTVGYAPVGNTQGTLVALDFDPDVVLYNGQLLEYGVDLYNPQRFRLTRADGTVYVVSQNGIESMTDPYGNSISYDENGIHHSSGASLSFDRGEGNRIETVTDPLGGQVKYYYNEEGVLENVVQVKTSSLANLVASYGYASGVFEEPVLKDITAPDGTVLGQFEYDSDGRMTALIDAEGNRIIYGYDLPNHQQEITDRRGKVTTYIYDSEGYVTSKLDPMGYETLWTYDENGHKLTETNTLGYTTDYTHDIHGNMLTEADPLGNTTTYTYNGMNLALTIKDALDNITTNTYDANGNLLSTVDPLEGETSYGYDSNGNLISMTDAMNNTTSYGYDSVGNIISETDALGNITTYTYDGYGNKLTQTVTRTGESGPVTMTTTYDYDHLNRLVKETDPDGNYIEMQYNDLDKVTRQRDKNGVWIELEYDNNGNQTLISFADGTTETYTYDEENNKLSFKDRDDRTTTYEYDDLGRLVLTTYADGSTVGTEYDEAGQVVATIDENTNLTEYDYDEAGRRVLIFDAQNNQTSFTYDKNGNQLTMTDANNHITQFEYDDLNRRIKTIYHDATFTQVAYDALGRKISETDQNLKTTEYGYDAMGRLTSVKDALSATTYYEYDEVGNKISQTDPNENTTLWDYDNNGQVIAHTLPLGMFETFTYDANGNMLTKTDFNGDTTTYEYSVSGRLLSETYEDSSQVTYTYTGTGQRETVTDSRGVTSYTYDLRDRLMTVDNPDSTSLSYTYDDAGNRTSVTVPSGTTYYTYDSLNRLETVIDPDSEVTSYTYDLVGNRARVTYPNGNITEYLYDSLNRLTYLENRKSGGDIISSFTYTLGSAGNRTSVAENTGRIVDYTYDDVYRLTEEAITDSVLGNETITYTYDDFGNRLTKTDSSGTITYTYDDNDRMESESGPAYTYYYSYDANGNTMSKSDGASSISYNYDYENRLILIDTDTVDTAYEYDADGIRVSSDAGGDVTVHLVDKNRDYAQVLEERDDVGTINVEYIYGDDLINQERSGEDFCYLYDGQLSTRQLTDDAEDVANAYIYDAFGVLLEKVGLVVNNYMYTGEQYDPNAGFYYLRARYYNQYVGRFIITDSREGELIEPITLHKYLYANVNPVIYNDPSGNNYTLVEQGEVLHTINTLFFLTGASWLALTQSQTQFYPNNSNEDIVYRGLGPKDGSLSAIPWIGIWAKGFINYTPSEHIAEYAKTKDDTGWISTSYRFDKAIQYATTGIATIDLDRIPDCQIFDTTKWYNKNILTEVARKSAEDDMEVLIWLHIPAYAIINVVPFKN